VPNVYLLKMRNLSHYWGPEECASATWCFNRMFQVKHPVAFNEGIKRSFLQLFRRCRCFQERDSINLSPVSAWTGLSEGR